MCPAATAIDIVLPTIGRNSLTALIGALDKQRPEPGHIYLVDDRPDRRQPLAIPETRAEITVLPGPARGPAAARNAGWRRARAAWIAFLDDDVVPDPSWAADLRADLADLPAQVAASQGRVTVPLAPERRPTDWERNVAGLESAAWITADMALRRGALEAAGGFDERFRSAYREDTDLALRLLRGGWQIVSGRRRVCHPPPSGRYWASVRLQRGNADDALMRALHGRHWRNWGRAPRGRLRRHLAYTGLVVASIAASARRERRVAGLAAFGAGVLWAELAASRISPGPRERAEVTKMLATSAVLPPAATSAFIWGLLSLPHKLGRGGPPFRAQAPARVSAPAAILLDRDGTLVFDRPYNGDPERVVPIPGVADALGRLRRLGIPIAVVSNQSGIGRGRISHAQVEAVNRRIDQIVGPIGAWLYCPHAPQEGCACRKPAAGLIEQAALQLGVPPQQCLMVGDIAADIQAAQAAGAAAVLIPTGETAAEDIIQAPWVAESVSSVVNQLFGVPR